VGFLNTRFIAAALVATALCLGCSTRLDRHWGEAHHAMVDTQTAHPNPATVDGTGNDGVSAGKAIESLRSSETLTTSPAPSLIEQVSGPDSSK
jgi:hypothetical protein